MKPDFMTIAKGLTSAYLPLSGVIVNERVWEVLEQGSARLGSIGHGWTYSAHPVCAAAGLANLDIIEREGLVENARTVGAYFQERLRSALSDHPMVGEVRGVGLLAAVEFAADKRARAPFESGLKIGQRVAASCLEHGMIARAMPHGDTLGFAPPLVLSKDEADIIVDISKKAIEQVWQAVARVVSAG
jgi:L-2,4-diaminobutyrate transaminase